MTAKATVDGRELVYGDDNQWRYCNTDELVDNTLEVCIVKDGGKTLGIELQEATQAFFLAIDQEKWPYLRVGKFPCKSDGSDYERLVARVYTYSKAVKGKDAR